MKSELASQRSNETWDLVDLPEGRSPIGCRWIFKLKRASDGSISRFKARLVAQGFSQREGIDYAETFAPVARFTSIRCLLAIAARKGYLLSQMDVCTAFLNGELDEEIYMKQPPSGCGKSDGRVCRLRRGIYGLKQSPRQWNKHIHGFLQSIGYVNSVADPCVYRLADSRGEVLVAVYVDDLAIAASSAELDSELKRHLHKQYKMTDLGDLEWILGMRVMRTTSGIMLDQEQYVTSILERFGFDESHPVATPVAAGTVSESSLFSDVSTYRSAVGSLMYAATGSRPDISFAVGSVARGM